MDRALRRATRRNRRRRNRNFRTACAERMRTDQVLCCHRTHAASEVVGITTDTVKNTKQQEGERT